MFTTFFSFIHASNQRHRVVHCWQTKRAVCPYLPDTKVPATKSFCGLPIVHFWCHAACGLCRGRVCVCVRGRGETCLPKLHQRPHCRPLLIPPRGLMKKTTTSACNNDIFHLKASFSLSSNDRLSFWLTFSGSATMASLFPAQIPTRLFPSHPWKEMKWTRNVITIVMIPEIDSLSCSVCVCVLGDGRLTLLPKRTWRCQSTQKKKHWASLPEFQNRYSRFLRLMIKNDFKRVKTVGINEDLLWT